MKWKVVPPSIWIDGRGRCAGERCRTTGAAPGLAITKHILDLHDSRIEVLSQGLGACFCPCLPVNTDGLQPADSHFPLSGG